MNTKFSLKKFIKYIFYPDFLGSYRSFDDIKLFDNYDNREFAKAYVRNNFCNFKIKENIILKPGLKTIEEHLLKSKNDLKILDLGGGVGTVYKYLYSRQKKHIKRSKITLFDTESMISEIQKYLSKNRIDVQMSLTSNLPKKKFDIIYVGSSLQYFKNYIKVLNYLCRYSENIILDDIPVSNKKTFANIQINMRPFKIPAWVFSETELNDYFAKKKWEVYYFFRNPRYVNHKYCPDGIKRSSISINIKKNNKL